MRRAPRSSAATRPGPRPDARVVAHADRSRCASASAASIREGSFPPAVATSAEPPPPPPTIGPSVRTSSVASGVPPVAAAMATFVPSGDPPSTTARTPSWRRIGLGQGPQGVGVHLVAAGHHHAAVGGGRLGQRRGLRLARLLAQTGQLLLGLALALGQAADGGQQLVGLRAHELGRRLHQALALEGTLDATRSPVTAKIRRVFEPMEPSDSSVMVPICPSESTWVPPQNSSEAGPACTTRTDEPYLSPKKAMAPMLSASSREVSVVSTGDAGQHGLVGPGEDLVELLAASAARGARSRSAGTRATRATLLAHVVAQHGPQRRVQQVGRRVVAPDGLAALAVDGGQRVLARPHLAGHPGPVRHQPRHGVDGV